MDSGMARTGQYLSAYDAIAVVQVVSRGGGVAGPDDHQLGARPRSPHTAPAAADAARDGFKVLRPTRFAVTRLLKGQLPPCLDLDVPGGTAGNYPYHSSQFPARFSPGDRMLGLFFTQDRPGHAVPPYAQALLLADSTGHLTLPFGDHDRIDINIWAPPAPEPYGPPVTQPPDPYPPLQCWAPGQPPPSDTDPPPCGRGRKAPAAR
jgi:hypothetical protein